MFTLIFAGLFLSVWVVCGALVWLAASVLTRGEAGLLTLPLAMIAGPIGGLAVPLLVREDEIGIWLSILAAIALPGLIVWARVFQRRLPRSARGNAEDLEVDS
ncbi:MAG: hypothetical protein ACE5EF_04575 [Dehalococcoidia bacterium]